MEKRISLRAKLGPAVLIFLFASAIYLYAFPQANLVYPAVVLAHAGLGLLATVGILWQVFRSIKSRNWLAATSWLVLGVGAIIGAALIYLGTSRPELRLLHIHIFASLLGGVLLLALWLQSRKKASGATVLAFRVVGLAIVAAAIAAGCQYLRVNRWETRSRIQNPATRARSMDQEGDGANGPFFPSSAQTLHKGRIPPNYFTESDACQRCHEDIYKQWNSSMHHFSSFNNQWYRKSIEYMQGTIGVKPSKWCAGCHDPALHLQRTVRYASEGHESASARGASRARLHDVPLHRAGEEHDGAGAISISNIRSCTSWRPAKIRWCVGCTISSSS